MQSFLSHDISLEPLCKEHLDGLSHTLRMQDRAEMWAAYRLPVRQGLELCFKRSVQAVALVYKGRAAAAAGVEAQTWLGQRACVWSWTGQAVERCPVSFWRASRKVLAAFQAQYPFLYAACDERYVAARRYLQRLGARQAGEKFYLAGRETRFVPYFLTAPAGRIFTDKES